MKKVRSLGATVFLLGLISILGGCGSSSSGGGFANVDVQYVISGNTITHNANEARDLTVPTAGTDLRVLTWFCGNYKGNQNKQVQLTFKKTNNTWVLDKEDVTGGNCG
jgi:hypothetical protein